MKNLFLFITIAFIYIFSSCKVCREVNYCPPPATAVEYFGAYTEGAYWIYHNHDSTKVDSVYITNYEMKREGDHTSACIDWDTKTFMLQSDFLSHIPIESEIGNGGYCDKATLLFRITTTSGICLELDDENTGFGNCGGNKEIELIKEFSLTKEANIKYKNVIIYDNRFWFAPGLGIIKYITQNNIDTFYLHKYEKL